MQQVPILNNDTNTIMTIPYEDSEIILKVKYLSIAQIWVVDIQFGEVKIKGLKLSCGVLLLKQKNLSLDFIVENNLKNGFDPYLENDFSDGNYSLFLWERADLVELRGYDVK